ncbi:MAG TPA: VTT domain-containing protein [Candidatus Paceibacterota bacterium]|jgi:membrane protein DedA with SNARE-associated domain|nr:VTT domain-containing protein [Candidatus Paceibacterota bacterium]
MLTLGYIKHFAELHAFEAYILIVIGVILEGEIVVVLAGIFSYIGSLDVFIAFLSTLLGASIKSVLGYSFGYYLNKNHSHRPILYKAEHRINYFLPRFDERPFWSLFLSRFLILGLYWFALIFAGYKRINVRTFIKAEISSFLVWSVAMLSLGYFFSFTALMISRDIRKVLIIIFVFFIAFFILEKLIAFVIELSGINKNLENINK